MTRLLYIEGLGNFPDLICLNLGVVEVRYCAIDRSPRTVLRLPLLWVDMIV
jgi:hypothetical protein